MGDPREPSPKRNRAAFWVGVVGAALLIAFGVAVLAARFAGDRAIALAGASGNGAAIRLLVALNPKLASGQGAFVAMREALGRGDGFARAAKLRRAGLATDAALSETTFLSIHLQDENLDALEWLLANGADPKLASLARSRTPLHGLARSAMNAKTYSDFHAKAAKLLVAAGADPNALDADGRSPLALSAAYSSMSPGLAPRGIASFVEAMLDLGADPDLVPPDDMPLLLERVWRSSDEQTFDRVTRRTMSQGAARAPFADYLMAMALSEAESTYPLDALLDAGADPNRIVAGMYPLERAVAWKRHSRMAVALLRRGADPNVRISHGSTAFGWCAARGEIDLAKMLLWQGADPDIPNADGELPLDVARAKGHRDFVAAIEADIAERKARAARRSVAVRESAEAAEE